LVNALLAEVELRAGNLAGFATLQELVDKSFQIRKSSQTSSWHKRRVEDAVKAYQELADE
jgi:hypothetical protein